jgi:beta-glucosidase
MILFLVEQEVVTWMKPVSHNWRFDNAGFSIDTEEGMYKPYADKKAKELERREREGGLPTAYRWIGVKQTNIGKQAKSSETLITIGRNGENADRNVENDFNLAIDEINLIDDVATAFHAQGKSSCCLNIV